LQAAFFRKSSQDHLEGKLRFKMKDSFSRVSRGFISPPYIVQMHL
jgi:hypothetical protein